MSRFRIVIDTGLCQGHSVCMAEAPELFRLIDSGGPYPLAEAIDLEPAPELIGKAEDAAEMCPNSAIRIQHLKD